MFGVIGAKIEGSYMILADGEYSKMSEISSQLQQILEDKYGKGSVIVKAVTMTPEKYEDIKEDSRLIKKELSVHF